LDFWFIVHYPAGHFHPSVGLERYFLNADYQLRGNSGVAQEARRHRGSWQA
jgi:hypothetical protein